MNDRDPRELVAAARTWLFVPGDRPELFDKAAASGADVVILDLEDAVPPSRKDSARAHVIEWSSTTPVRWAVRINAAGTPWHDHDVEALQRVGPAAVMLPKAQDPSEVERCAVNLPDGSAIVALVETASGVLNAVQLARTPSVARLVLGSLDLAAELGVDPDHPSALGGVRQTLVLASASAGLIGPVDGVTTAVNDVDRLSSDVRTAKAIGFSGKLCIHPAQVHPAAAALAPTAEERAWADDVLRTVGDSENELAVLDGQMIDAPVIARALRIRDDSARADS